MACTGRLAVMGSRLPLADGDPGWWGYAEKDAWHAFCDERPGLSVKIETFVNSAYFVDEKSSDPVLSSGVQIEGKYLRVAELLGFTDVDR
jgi:hypothetical protein